MRKKLPLRRIARGVYLDEQQRVLLAQQNNELQKWQFTGGNIKRNEDPAAAIVRESYEEAGLMCPKVKLILTERIATDEKNELIFCFRGLIRNSQNLRPDGTEIKAIALVSLDEAVTVFDLTDTTKLLLSNIQVIGLFLRRIKQTSKAGSLR